MNPFENYILSLGKEVGGYTVLTFKWNLIDASSNIMNAVYDYALSCNQDEEEDVFATAGQHNQGKNEEPHIHLNVVIPKFKKDSNESRRRKKYLSETWDVESEGITCKIKQIETVRDLENTLKYCWKEEQCLPLPKKSRYIFSEDVRLYLIQSAVSLFEASRDNQRKKERATAVAKTLLGQIEDIVGNQTFASYTDFKIYVAQKFLEPLEVEEYPDFNNLRKAMEKVAVKRRIVPFHFFL